MMVEAYFTFFEMIQTYGAVHSWAVISFIVGILFFVLSAVATLIIRRLKLNAYLLQFVLVEAYFFLFYLGELIWNRAFKSEFLMQFFMPGLYAFIFFVLPGTFLYKKILGKWPILPWHFVQFCLCLLGSGIFWALAIFWFQVFKI